MGWLSKNTKPSPPPTVPTDTVVPLHFFDDQFFCRALVLNFTVRFDDVLDPDKLRNALERLMQIGDWRKIGARLRENAQGKLEYHIPASYDENRPGFKYSRVNTNISIEDHYLARRFPKGGSEPALFEDPAKFEELVCRQHTPTRIEDWIYTDHPPLSIHIVTFTDATLLTLSWSHTFLDAVGRMSLLKAWISVLNGREQDVLPFQGFDKDPLETLNGKTPPEKHVLYNTTMGGLTFFLFIVYTILEFLFHPKQETRMVYLPGQYLKKMREQALEELSTTSADQKPFVSEGDVLLAWWGRTTAKALKLSSSKPVALNNVVNFRGLVDDVLPSNEAYLGNAAMSSSTFLTAGQLLRDPLSTTAMKVRRSLEQQRTREQVEAFVALYNREARERGRGPLFGTYNQVIITLSNWHAARFFNYDFSAAAIRPGVPLEQRSTKLGYPAYICVSGHENGFSIRNAGPCIGKDAAGNWWISWALRTEAWPAVEEELRLMSGKKTE